MKVEFDQENQLTVIKLDVSETGRLVFALDIAIMTVVPAERKKMKELRDAIRGD